MLVGGRLLVGLIGVLSVGLGTRYLGVHHYGDLVVATAFVSFFVLATDIGVYTIAAREIAKDPQEADSMLGSAFGIGLTAGALATVAALVLTEVFYRGPQWHFVRVGVFFLVAQILLAVPSSTLGAYFIAQQRAYVSVVGEVCGKLGALGLLAAAASLGWGYAAVASTIPAASLLASLVMVALARGRIRMRPRVDRRRWTQLLKWALPLAGVTIINYVYLRLDTILLGFLASRREVAFYGVAYKVVELLIPLPTYFMITLFPTLAQLDVRSERLTNMIERAMNMVTIFGIPFVLVTIVFAREIVRIIAGPSFAPGGVPLQILMLGVGLSYISGVFGNVLIAANQQRALLWIAALVLATNLALNLILIPLWGMNGAATAGSLTEALAIISIAWLYRRMTGTLPRLQNIVRILAAAATMSLVFAVKLVPGHAHVNPLLLVVASATVALTVYVLVLRGLGAMPEEIESEILLPLRRKLGRA